MTTEDSGQIARATLVDVPMREQRSLATVTAEIRSYQDAARKMMITYCIEVGRRLVEAKSLVGHGEWGAYLRDELGFSQSRANDLMRLFDAYAADQIRLDGTALKSQSFGNLSYTQALALLALPSEEEREAFVESHDMSAMSTRELQEELRRRGEGRQIAGATDGDGVTREELEGRLDKALNEIRDQEIELRSMKDKVRTALEDRDKAEAGEDQEYQRANALKIERDNLRDQVSTAQTERDRAQAASAEAERKAKEAADKVTAMQKELALAAPELAVFRARFERVQADLSALVESVATLPEDKQPGARRGMAAMLQKAHEQIGGCTK